MRSSSRAIATVMALVSVMSSRAACAQDNEPATIPTALATALMTPFYSMLGERPHFVVHRTPEGWPADLSAPAPASLVGGSSFGPVRSVVYRYPRRVDAVKTYERVLAGAGFTHGTSMGRPQGGFTSRAPAKATAWCRKDGRADVIVVDSSATTRSLLVMFVSTRDGFGPCNASPSGAESWKPPLALPTLTAPIGVEVAAQGVSYSGDRLGTSASVDTSMSVDSLLDHYTRQLAAAGWQVGKRLSDGGTAVQTLSMRDPDGKLWSGALTLVTAVDRRTLLLNMMAAPQQR